jgi:hypothetical protein
MQAGSVKLKGDSDTEKEVPGEYVYSGSVANKALELLAEPRSSACSSTERKSAAQLIRGMRDEELEAFIEECNSDIAAIRKANGHPKHSRH